jgi:hypothetical protein
MPLYKTKESYDFPRHGFPGLFVLQKFKEKHKQPSATPAIISKLKELIRMKYGAHIFLWIERWDNRQVSLFERIRKLGLDVLEIAVGDDVEFDAARVKQAAENSGIELVSPGGVWPMELKDLIFNT